MNIPKYEGYGRTIMVRFQCRRCEKIALRKLEDCVPSDSPVRDLYDLIPPKEWKNGGFYYPTFCPDCAKAYDQFINGG